MPRMLADRHRSRRLSHLLTGLYRAHLGWMLGHRFLLLTHTGRTSGLKRQTVLEVMRHDRSTGMYVVASGWGAKADWLRNVTQTPAVIVQSGRERHAQPRRACLPTRRRGKSPTMHSDTRLDFAASRG